MDKRTGRTSFLVVSQLTAAVFMMTGVALAGDEGAHFVHHATAENITFDRTAFSHPLTDGNPDAIVHVTQNWNPPGSSGTYNLSPVGVWYINSGWTIASQFWSEIPVGAAFNIWIPPVDASTFVHAATAGNTSGPSTTIDNPLTNGNPNARLRVTQSWNPGGGAGFTNDSVIGVWYTASAKWAIFNQDLAAMPVGASFNVTVLPDDQTATVHTATPANTIGNWTSIDHPLTNNNPNAIVSITQSMNPGGTGGVFNDHVVGVWYHDGLDRWAVFNQDGAAIPDGASFNVSAPSLESASFVHSAHPGNTTVQTTYIDHPLSNDNPNAILFITQNWNPGGSGGIINDHTVGTYYNSSETQWTIFNQDLVAIPEGASFNVSIPAVDASSFVHTATADSITDNWTTVDNPVTNGNPSAIIHVTQNYNPSGVGGVFNDHTIGVWYDGANWAIFNQDHATIPDDSSFNVSIPAVDASTFVHTASAANTSGSLTIFHHPLTDGNPDAIVRVTQNWNPGGGTGVYNDHEIGVAYTGADWSIFNQDDAPMPESASFNVTVEDPSFFADGFESGDTSAWSSSVP